jgi:hypothetical protein
MKRDMDLIRSILQKVASCDDPYGLEHMPEIEGHSTEQVSYHLKLMYDAGLIEALANDSFTAPYLKFNNINLTWHGQDFLDTAKDDSIWNKAKDKFLKPGVSFTFDLLKAYLTEKAKEKLGL